MRKLTLFLVLLCCTVFVSPAIAANKVRAFVAVNGGGVGALDRVSQANFEDGDISIVVITGTQLKYTYVYDEDGEQAEDATYFTIIRPDDYAVGVHDLVRVAYLTRVVTADGDTDPGVNDDIDTQTGAVDLNFAGYVPGDFWINDTASPTLFWVCIKNTDTAAVWQELTGDGTFEPIDAAIVKSDEAETITANWDFSTDSTSDLDDADISNSLTLSLLKLTALDAEPSEVVGEIYLADQVTWDPAGLGAVGAYYVVCTVDAGDGAPGTFIALFDVTGTWYVSQIGTPTPLAGATNTFAANFTGSYLYGGTYIATSDGGDLQLPLMVAGMNFCIITAGAIQVVAASHVDDGYLLDGTDTAENNSVVNTSTAGDIACFQYYTAADWLITTNGWTTE